MSQSKNNSISIHPPNLQTSKHITRTHSFIAILVVLTMPVLISQCGLDIEDPTPPSPPVWVQKSLPEEWPEHGIDAHETGGIYIEWGVNVEEKIEAYKIYRAEYYSLYDSLGEYDLLLRLETGSLNQLIYIDLSARVRIKYCYKLKAVDTAENESEYSDSLCYILLPQQLINAMLPNGNMDHLNSERQLRWIYDPLIEMENYCITILSSNNDFVLRQLFMPQDYTADWSFWNIPDSVPLINEQVYKWRIDTGANYLNGIETSGGESPWATFLYSNE
jgi:hypothetical protein